MKVLHVINRLSGRAGAEISLRDIVTSDRSGLEHAIVVLAGDGNVLEPFEASGIPCFVPGQESLGWWRQVRHVRAAIRTFRPDLVHTSLFDADQAGRIAGFVAGVPVVSSIVNTPYALEAAQAEVVSPWKLRAVRVIDGWLARHLTSAMHAISEATATHAVEHLRIPRQRIRVVPRGRSRVALGDPSRERRRVVRDELGWGERPIVISVARQEPQKGHRYLIEAFAALLTWEPEALLVMVGRDGRSTDEVDARIRTHDIADAVVRLGVRTDVPDLVAAADVFAFPSLYEGLGGAAVEALGLGTPIVATDVPALRELIGEDRGWLVPPADADALAHSIREVLEGGDEVERRARNARRTFLERYELEACVVGMVRFYRDVETRLGERGPRPWRPPPRLDLAQVAGGSEA